MRTMQRRSGRRPTVADGRPPVISGDSRADRALVDLAQVLAEIAHNPVPKEEAAGADGGAERPLAVAPWPCPTGSTSP